MSRGGKGVPVYVQAFLTATGEKVPGTSDYYKLTRDDGNDRYTMKCPKEFMEHGVTLKTTIGFKGQVPDEGQMWEHAASTLLRLGDVRFRRHRGPASA